MGYQITRIRNIAQKVYFWSQKNVFYIIFSCLKMVFCDLMLCDLLGLSLLRNFYSAAQKTACTRNEAMDVTFQMKHFSAF